MNKILIIKLGDTLTSLISKKGDFDQWILSGMEISKERVIITKVYDGSPLPNYDKISGIVITGSHSMVTEHQDWSELTAEWLPGAVKSQIPILGICYGHQLLAYSMGGKVDINRNGRNFGTIKVKLTESARRDPLLGCFSSPIKVHVAHYQSVLSLPGNATLLASSDKDVNQAFVVGSSAWGVQFHPEFDAEILIEYINHFREKLLQEGQNPDLLIERCVDTPFGSNILKRFVEITDNPSYTKIN